MRLLATLAFLVLAPASVAATESTRWFEVHSEHFDVLTDASPNQARHIAAQLEEMRIVFRSLLLDPGPEGSPIVVFALKDRKSFQALEPTVYLAKGKLDLTGFFLSTPDRNYILLRLDTQEEHPFETIYHEYTHYMMRASDWLPLWLNEGLAEFYQNTDIHPNEVVYGQPSGEELGYLRRYLAGNRLLPLETLFSIDHESPYYHEEEKGSIFYAESWALTHYLFAYGDQNGTAPLHDYMVLLSKGEEPVTAARHAFGDLGKLQQRLEDYIGRGVYKRFTGHANFAINETSLKAEPIPTVNADALRADILAYNGRTTDAQKLIQTMLSENPKNALAYESMGFLKFRQRDYEAARKWYGEAVELDSNNYLANFYFANLSLIAGDKKSDALVEAGLLKCIHLNPEFAPGYDALAQFYALRHEKLEDAEACNKRAIALDPGNVDFRLNTAQVFLVGHKFPAAIEALKAAKKIARSSAEEKSIQERIDHLQTYVDALGQP